MKKKTVKKCIFLSFLALAIFGGYSLYNLYNNELNSGIEKTREIGSKVKEVIKNGYEELK